MLRRIPLLLAAALLLAGAQVRAANPQVDLDTSAGKIRIELYPDAAPKTVENFLAYVKAKQYDGTQFHRVIPGFMIQGGGFTEDFQQKPTRPPVQNEAEQSSKAGHLNVPGSVAMARTGDPHSATAQFFINVADNKFLNFKDASPQGFGYTVFAKVIQGMDVVTKIAGAPTGPGGPFPKDVPVEHVILKTATIVQNWLDMVILHTNHGPITIKLDAEHAPKSVANFLEYVRAGHFDNTVFHRVIDGFMIQGGGFTPDFKQKPTRAAIENEAKNGLKNKRYSVAMARTSDPHSATAQFFINVGDNTFLDHRSPDANGWGYAVFGHVVAGTDVVDHIKGLPTGTRGFHQDVPTEDVIIERAEEKA